jgi:hypothetical protein
VKKRTFPPQALLALVIVGLLVVAAAGYFLVVGPQKSQAASLKKEIASTQKELDATRSKSLAAKKVQPIKIADLFRLAKAMPDQPDMSGVLLQLNQVASDTGITFDSITPEPTVPQAGYQVVPIQLVFTGNFYNLSDLLFRLRNLVVVDGGRLDATGRLFAVDTLSFGPAPAGFPQIQASLTVDAFVYGTGITATVPAPATTAPAGTDTTSTTTTGTDTTATTTAATTAPAPPTGAGASATGAQ